MLKRRQETTFELIPESSKLLVIPGIQADGNNVFAVREAARVARRICARGEGPIFLEVEFVRMN